MTPENLDLIGGWVSLVLTLLVFSYLLADTFLYRIAVYLLVGVAAGYTVVGAGAAAPDLRDAAAVDDFLARERPDAVFLLGGRSGGIARNQREPASLMLDNLLVESAVIQGMETGAMPLRIRVRARAAEDRVELEVASTGRLRLVLPGRRPFQVVEEDGWVRAVIELKRTPAREDSYTPTGSR